MWPVSSLWDNAVRNSQVIELRVDVYRDGVLLASDIPIEPDSGTITVDRAADVRRTVELTVPDPSLIPTSAADPLSPYGSELRITRGFRYPDGSVELVPVGVFRIDKPAVTLMDGVVRVSGADYCRLLAEDVFLNPAQSITTNTVIAEMIRLIQSTQPGVVVTDTSGASTICALTNWEQESSRYSAVKELALSIGVDVAPDAAGNWLIRRLPDLATATPVWTVNAGSSGVLIDGDEEQDRERIFNAWIVRGEPGDGSNPVQSIVYDTDPSSQTYWSGPFGHRAKVFSSPLLATVDQCTAVGTTLLAQSLQAGAVERMRCVPNPALDVGDVITLITPARDESSLPTSENYMVHSITLPLALGEMELDLTAPLPQ